jgi:DNA-binding NarL/FixJ family response regulator
MIGAEPATPLGVDEPAPLTPKQWLVLREIATGATYMEVADRLSMPYQSVKNYTVDIRNRLGAESTIECFVMVGWLVVPE